MIQPSRLNDLIKYRLMAGSLTCGGKTMGNGSDKKPSEGGVQAFLTRLLGGGNEDSVNWRFWLLVSVCAAGLFLIFYALSAGGVPRTMLRNIAAGLLVAAAAAAVGVILGFLFGIPRSLQRDDTAQNAGEPFQSVRANTNLEQISDWLTKIIVGVGLVQAGKIVAIVEDMAAKIGPLFIGPWFAVPGNASAPAATSGSAFVLVLMVLFSILGFLVGYLWARIYLQEAFNDMEQRARRQPEYFEGLMNSYLYMPAPKGFREALKLRDQYKKTIGDALTDRMWTYLVCALGQQYAWKEEMKATDDLPRDKAELVDALKTALRKDAEARSLLRLELEPDGRMPNELFEGDLRSFRNDPCVRYLLRKDPTAPWPATEA
jgi:hypothetical protein